VSRQTRLHRGQRPWVSKVFQLCPQLEQSQRESARGFHLHLGQYMFIGIVHDKKERLGFVS
jgi:hypothetical protein